MMLRGRSDTPEVMDAPGIDEAALDLALRELETINRLLGGHRTSRIGIERLTWRLPRDAQITILDIGAGGNDLQEILRPLGRRFDVTALDINPLMHGFAARHGHVSRPVTGSAHTLTYEDRSFDIVHASLFLHHCTDQQAVLLLRRAARIARLGVIINDLHRHVFALAGISLLTALFARSPIVRNDARISVRRGFTRREFATIVQSAFAGDSTLSWHWAFRWCLLFPLDGGNSGA